MRLDPCGCLLCKDCMIQFLAENWPGGSNLSCRSCGKLVTSHNLLRSSEKDKANLDTPTIQDANLRKVQHVYTPQKHTSNGSPDSETGKKASLGARNKDFDTTRAAPAAGTFESSTLNVAIPQAKPATYTGDERESPKEENTPENIKDPETESAALFSARGKHLDTTGSVPETRRSEYPSMIVAIPQADPYESRKEESSSRKEKRKEPVNKTSSWKGPPTKPSSIIRPSPATANPDMLWQENFDALAAFQRAHGHTRVSVKGEGDLGSLGSWVGRQRLIYRRGAKNSTLTAERIEKLEDLGFEWSLYQKTGNYRKPRSSVHASSVGPGVLWLEKFDALKAFKEEYGHTRVPIKGHGDWKSLGKWVNNQRINRRRYGKNTRLTEEHINKLDSLGFEWDIYQKKGKCSDSPEGNATDNPSSGEKNENKVQKKVYKQRKTFEERCQALKEFKDAHGHINVPYAYQGDRSLGEWVKDVRRGHLKVTMDQRKVLNSHGFIWETRHNKREREWYAILGRLRNFTEQFGHCRVPAKFEQDSPLSEWVRTQRREYKKGNFRPDRKKALDAIGFVWSNNGQSRQPTNTEDSSLCK